MSDEFDQVRSFVFEGYPVRGAWVRLKASFLANCAHHDYPLVVRTVLGEALAASVLLGNSIKLNGLMTLQLQGPGPLTLLVVQLTDRLSFRGVARYQTPLPVDATSLKALSGEGSLFVTIDQANSDHRYQGIVAMGEGSLAHSLQDYLSGPSSCQRSCGCAATAKWSRGLWCKNCPAAVLPRPALWARLRARIFLKNAKF